MVFPPKDGGATPTFKGSSNLSPAAASGSSTLSPAAAGGRFRGSFRKSHHRRHSSQGSTTAGRKLLHGVHSKHVSTVAAIGNKSVVTGDDEGTVYVSSWADSTQLFEWQAHSRDITQVTVDASGKTIATASRDCTVRLWRHEHVDKPIGELAGHDLLVTAIDFCKVNPTVICSGSRDGTVVLWDVGRARKQQQKNVNRNLVTGIKWLTSEPVFIQSSEDKALRMWDTREGLASTNFMTTEHIHRCCDVHPDDTVFVTGSGGFSGDGCVVTEWDRRQTKVPLNTLVGHMEGINTCKVLRVIFEGTVQSQCMYASGSQEGEVILWKAAGNAPTARLSLGCGPVQSIDQVGNSTLCCGTFNGGAVVVDIVEKTPEVIELVTRHFF